jgi:uncharacterized protein YecE (DUF72 family)
MKWYVGTSGWGYDNWDEEFYTSGLPAKERLAYYARYLDAVEINNTFYNLPSAAQIKKWEESVPKHFTFAIKASRYITHQKKLTEPREVVSRFMEPMRARKKKGPIIFQLPPNFPKDLQRLSRFLKVLPARQRYAVEFRDPSWHAEDIYERLRQYKVAFCLFEKSALLSPRVTTAEFNYLRLHGRKAGYKGNYDTAALKDWHRWLKAKDRDAYVFFDNTAEKMYALENALTFQKLTRK